MAQSDYIENAGIYGNGQSVKQPVSAFFSSLGKLASLIPGGPVSADAAASDGAKPSDFPKNGDPIVAPGGGIEAATRTKAEAIALPPQFSPGIPPWLGIAAAVAALIVLSKIVK